MILKPEMPTTGQFVAVWESGGEIWADTLCWHDGELYVAAGEGWELATEGFCEDNNALFLLKD